MKNTSKRKHTGMDIGSLINMLTYQRGHRSEGEARFLKKYLSGYPQDGYGNIRVEVHPGSTSTLFSCHTDSVHPKTGVRQQPMIDGHRDEAFKGDKYALGADDAIGVWLMLHMIEQDVPGVYVFHRDEEVGGLGSDWIRCNDPDFLKRFDRAVAFDRRGVSDVITHQGGERCCSNAFADLLALELGRKYKRCPDGIFTDTANYLDLIPECTNISVGYENEHSGAEVQDLEHAQYLYDTVCGVDWEALPTERDPEVVENIWYSNYGDDDWMGAAIGKDDLYLFTDKREALEMVCNDPEEAARLLYQAYRCY